MRHPLIFLGAVAAYGAGIGYIVAKRDIDVKIVALAGRAHDELIARQARITFDVIDSRRNAVTAAQLATMTDEQLIDGYIPPKAVNAD